MWLSPKRSLDQDRESSKLRRLDPEIPPEEPAVKVSPLLQQVQAISDASGEQEIQDTLEEIEKAADAGHDHLSLHLRLFHEVRDALQNRGFKVECYANHNVSVSWTRGTISKQRGNIAWGKALKEIKQTAFKGGSWSYLKLKADDYDMVLDRLREHGFNASGRADHCVEVSW